MIELPFFHGLPVAVMGLGKSGLAAARALQASGGEVWAWDDSEDRRAEARAAGVPLVDLHSCNWAEVPSLVLSPGIPDRFPEPHPVAAAARAAGAEVIGDIELLGRACPDASYIGITGTNGKSTTTALIGHILKLSGRDCEVGGNLGPSVMEFEMRGSSGSYVLEMSSYQLERTFSITFDVAVLLNISPDHLDRHGGLQGYVAAKRNIFRRQTAPRTAVIGVDDETCRAIHAELLASGDQSIVAISGKGPVAGGVYVENGVLIDDTEGKQVPALPLSEVATLPGLHNAQNAAAAYAACKAAGVDPAVIAACIRSFPGLAHRQEVIAVIDGVAYINDSKATNADATAKALACYRRIHWIAGGRAKEGGLAGLERYYPKISRAYLIGEAAEAFASDLQGAVASERCGNLKSAVAAASKAAKADGEGAVVLLSPACASFDQFANFEARGEAFRALVEALPGTREDIDVNPGGRP
ncbi:MAG: UDP-N-acetylmuramoyl-L-alanine--D-glutamate ligase [Rhodovibrionaceae bacterium]